MKKIYFLLLFICSLTSLFAQSFNFESSTVPTNFVALSGGSISVSTERYKMGVKSLKWEWVKGSYLKVSNLSNLSAASKSSSGGIIVYVYNSAPVNSNLMFRFYDSTGQNKCTASMNLNYSGWRTIWNRFVEDMKHDYSTLTDIRIYPPSGESGVLYFDLFEISSSVVWSRMSDNQFTVSQSPSMEDFIGKYQYKVNSQIVPTQEEIRSVAKIIDNVDEWFLGTNNFSSTNEYKLRRSRIDTWMNNASNNVPRISRNSDGTPNAKGVFMMDYTATIDGEQPTLFRNISADYMIPLAYDYRLNGKAASLDKLTDLYDWFNDQGWAGGSSLGSLYFEKLRSAGYFYSLFLARNGLDNNVLSRELEALRWYSLFGTALSIDYVGDTADNLRTLLLPKLFYALMLQTDAERVSAMRSYRDYCIKAFEPTSAYFGSFFVDGLGGHHLGPYLSAYYPQALYVASQVAMLLKDTEFELPDSTLQTLKKGLLSLAEVCAVNSAPAGVSGRFPQNPLIMDQQVFAYSYLALAMDNDVELTEVFMRLWQPESAEVKKRINRTATDITFTTTLGEVEAALKVADLSVEEQQYSNRSAYFPYAGLAAFRSKDSHVTVKGTSKYIWNFESSTSENIYGRYLSTGFMEFTDLETGLKNPSIPLSTDASLSSLFRWSRLPGTTAIDFDNSQMDFNVNSSKHRYFTDQAFLGGATLNDSVGSFGMKYRDLTFNNNIYFNKSVFRIGADYFCVASGISNNVGSRKTITTLFQIEQSASDVIKVNNSVSNGVVGVANPHIIDNLGTHYFVLDGNVNMEINTVDSRQLGVAYIDHLTLPSNKGYAYVMMHNPSDEHLQRWQNIASRPIQLLSSSNDLHHVYAPELKVRACNVFNASQTFANQLVKSVSAPCLFIEKEKGEGSFTLAISEPDLRRPTGLNIDAISLSNRKVMSSSSSFSVVLNGLYELDNVVDGFSVTYEGNTTVISGSVTEGRNYIFNLKEKPSNVKLLGAVSNFLHSVKDGVLQVSSSVNKPFNISLYGLSGSLIYQRTNIHSNISIPLGYSKGSYILNIKDENSSELIKLIQ